MEEKLKIIRELKQKLVKNFGDNIINVILFGSQVTGKATEFSDWDVMIVLKNNYDWKLENQILNVCCDIQIDYEIYLDIIIISQTEIQNSLRGKQPIITDTLLKGIYI